MHRSADTLLEPLTALLAGISALLLIGMLGFLLAESWPALAHGGWLRFAGLAWYPLEGSFGLAAMFVATIAVATLAILLAAPLGLACALFARFQAPPALAGGFRGLLALMAGVPSVVYGFWGLTVLVPLVARWQPPGASLFTAGLVLALMILPTVALLAHAALAAVPRSLLDGAAALGLTQHTTLLKVAVPAARRGIVGGVLLGLARALGETMAVLMVAGNVVQLPVSVFDPVRVLTANIALEMAYAADTHRAGLFVSGLLLALLVLGLAWFAARLEPRHA
ncbi:MAG: phosphate ABC transporter permease subunit PstC [Gammaproteobacteria bacterium]|nr:phosphate ABC transporter permease subunit PstC [Gammaproteobacteria bacterium]